MRPSILYLLLPTLFLGACHQEEWSSTSDNEETKNILVSITVATGGANTIDTRSNDEQVAGTCHVNTVRLLVFKGPAGAGQADLKNLTYQSETIIPCSQEGGLWVARGTIPASGSGTNTVFAIAYDDDTEGAHFSVNHDNLTFSQVKVQLEKTLSGSGLNIYNTPEFFVGHVIPQGSPSWVFSVDQETQLTGSLHRSVGKCTFKISEIPPNIKKMAWLTEKIASYDYLYDSNIVSSDYPMGFAKADDLTKQLSQVASIENNGDTVWNASLSSFFIPLSETLFYIDATDDTNTTNRYLVKSAGNRTFTIWIGVITYIVKDYRFTIPFNYQVTVSGKFSQLKNSGNMLIDLSDITDEYVGGLLPPSH